MKIKTLSRLNKPFPLLTSPGAKVLVPVSFGIFVFLFLSLYQPFGINTITSNKFGHLADYGIITTAVMLINFLVLPLLFKNFFDGDKWTVLKTIAFIFWNFLLISIGNWTYNTVTCHEAAKQHNLFQFIFITLSVGIFPVVFLIFYLEKQFNKKNIQLANILSSRIQATPTVQQNRSQITIHSEENKDVLTINPEDLLYIASDGNYADAYYLQDDIVKKKLLRISLIKIEKQLNGLDSVFRCHRSYIINTKNIKKVRGNARSCFVFLNNLDIPIPISRSCAKIILESFNTK